MVTKLEMLVQIAVAFFERIRGIRESVVFRQSAGPGHQGIKTESTFLKKCLVAWALRYCLAELVTIDEAQPNKEAFLQEGLHGLALTCSGERLASGG